jgi:hypothetical protein
MTSPAPTDAHVRLDTHPEHPSAITATLTGPRQDLALRLLLEAGFEAVGHQTLVMARIDNEEPYWAHKTAQTLTANGIPTQITDRLRAAIDEEWTWANYPWPWCTRQEIREASNDAQKIHDDIRHGRLLVHAHAQDGEATVAVATYLDSSECVYLHGQDHLRHGASTFDSLAHGFTEFARMHGDTMHPGPAPATPAERAAIKALTMPVTSEPTTNLPRLREQGRAPAL